MTHPLKIAIAALIACMPLSGCGDPGDAPQAETWPAEVRTVHIAGPADGPEQPAKFWTPAGLTEAAPLVVALHTWSFDYSQPNTAYYTECRKRGWTLIHPNFRGQNKKPEACGSPLVVADILDAVRFAKDHALVDEDRIYLVGGSGGGYASLLMAGRAPDIWAGVSAWCPITDLAQWHGESLRLGTEYHAHLEAVCGGAPGESAEIDEQYRERSAMTHLPNAKGVHIEISTGIHDGHTGSVPVSHTLKAFNLLAELNGFPETRLSGEEIAAFTGEEKVPEHLSRERPDDPAYSKSALFRREAGPARVTIFDGGHDILIETAFVWLEKQRKSR